MDTKKLRQKILDFAIRGKLVPQDPNDEPASVLLERIKEEKERLIKEGKIKKSKRMASSDTPHYENVPFEIPDNWEWCKLEEICNIKGGKRIPKGKGFSAQRTEHIYLRVTNMKNRTISFDDLKYIDDDVFQEIKNYTISSDDLYLTIAGTIGDVGEIPQEVSGMNLTENAAKLTDIVCDRLYLMYSLLSTNSQEHFSSKFHQVAQPKLSIETASSTLLPLPPFAEQHRIVAEIERWFSLIDIIENDQHDLQTTVKQTKSKILDLAIHGKLVPQNPNDEPAIELLKRINPDFTPCDNGHSRKLPQGWCSVTVNDVCSIIGGVSYNKADIQDTGIRVLRGGNIQNGKVIDCFDDVFISLSYQNNDNQVQRGDIIVVASTGSQTLIGKTGFADRDIPKTQIGAFLRIVRPKQKTLSPYIRLIFQTDAYKDYIRNVAKGSNINNVKNAHLQNFQICLPPLEEQQRIVQKIEELFSSLDDILTALEV